MAQIDLTTPHEWEEKTRKVAAARKLTDAFSLLTRALNDLIEASGFSSSDEEKQEILLMATHLQQFMGPPEGPEGFVAFVGRKIEEAKP